MERARISELRVVGFKALKNVQLSLNGLTVLVGDNGTGKSSILEVLDIVRSAATPLNHINDVIEKKHGSLRNLLHRGEQKLTVRVWIESAGRVFFYGFDLGLSGTNAVVDLEAAGEIVAGEKEPLFLLKRTAGSAEYKRAEGNFENFNLDERSLALSSAAASPSSPLRPIITALEGIEVHAPFDTRPIWQQRELKVQEGPRWPSLVEHTERLERFGVNLPNAYHRLRNQGGTVWDRVMQRARLGLGEDLRDIRLPPSGRGNIELEVLFGSLPEKALPAEVLSEGQISYLAFVALCELDTKRSLLAIDEPEVHLHPSLLARVAWMLEESAVTTPVIVATHSDRFLDALENGGKSVVLCDLDETRAARLTRPDAEILAKWQEDYAGIGSIRSAGFEAEIFKRETSEL